MARAQTIPEEETKLHHIFADETCQVRHRWMVLGMLLIPDERIGHVRAMFSAWKREMGLHGEIKWEYTDKRVLTRYKRLVDVAFTLINHPTKPSGIMQFHCMQICMDVVDDQKFNEGIPDLGYSKFFHHLLLKHLGANQKQNKYYVLFDKRTSKVPMDPFRDAANFAAARHHGMDHWPIRRMQYQDSKSDILFQINDLLLGAVGFERNGKHHILPNSPKAELAAHVRKKSPVRSFLTSSGEDGFRFTIWRFRFGGKKGKEAFRNRKKFQRGQGRTRKPKLP